MSKGLKTGTVHKNTYVNQRLHEFRKCHNYKYIFIWIADAQRQEKGDFNGYVFKFFLLMIIITNLNYLLIIIFIIHY